MSTQIRNLIFVVLILGAVVAGIVGDKYPGAVIVGTILSGLVVAVGYGLFGTAATEILKIFMRFILSIFKDLPEWIPAESPSGAGSIFLAGIVAIVIVLGGDVNLLTTFGAFKYVDPEQAQMISSAIVWFLSMWSHDALLSSKKT